MLALTAMKEIFVILWIIFANTNLQALMVLLYLQYYIGRCLQRKQSLKVRLLNVELNLNEYRALTSDLVKIFRSSFFTIYAGDTAFPYQQFASNIASPVLRQRDIEGHAGNEIKWI